MSCSFAKLISHLHHVKQYHGGTNFGRSAGGPFITTSYDYDAPLDEYGENKKLCFFLFRSNFSFSL